MSCNDDYVKILKDNNIVDPPPSRDYESALMIIIPMALVAVFIIWVVMFR